MNVLDRLKSGEWVLCHIEHHGSDMYECYRSHETIEAEKELIILAERGARYRWVPVSERLPDEGKQVIICTTAADVCTGFARWGGSFATEEGCELYLADVTHWMPIPEPEEEG